MVNTDTNSCINADVIVYAHANSPKTDNDVNAKAQNNDVINAEIHDDDFVAKEYIAYNI